MGWLAAVHAPRRLQLIDGPGSDTLSAGCGWAACCCSSPAPPGRPLLTLLQVCPLGPLPPAAFYEVTSIADAVALWKTMQEKGQVASEATGAAAEEEVEDEAGNVYSRKVGRAWQTGCMRKVHSHRLAGWLGVQSRWHVDDPNPLALAVAAVHVGDAQAGSRWGAAAH